MTVDGPRQGVFNTVELLEQILSFLPAKSIFGSLRVCRAFRDVVGKSVLLQKHMFLRVGGEKKQTWIVQKTPCDIVYPMRFVPLTTATQAKNPEGEHFTPVTLNPMLKLYNVHNVGHIWKGGSAPRALGRHGERVRFRHTVKVGAVQSWHQTFLTSPPTTKARIKFAWKISSDVNGEGIAEIEDENGITLGMMFTAALEEKELSLPYWSRTTGAWDGIEGFEGLGNIQEPDEWDWGPQKHTQLGDRTVGELIKGLEQKHSRKAIAGQGNMWIHLVNVVVPNAGEWAEFARLK